MPKEVITVTTDFGDAFALAQLELVIAALNGEARIVNVSNTVSPFSVIEGAFVLSKVYRLAPPGSIHLGVVDPGVGSERSGLLIRSRNHWFIGPNNGLLYPAARDDGIIQAYRLEEDRIAPIRSNTFHGRDVFARAAGLLTRGVRLEEFCVPLETTEIIPLEFSPYQVVHVDPYGNIKLSSEATNFSAGDRVLVGSSVFEAVIPFCRTFEDVGPGELLIYEGSHQTLEVAQRLGSAVEKFQVKTGDVLSVERLED